MMWFCNCVHTYLTTIVLGPSMHKLRQGLREALDVDAMISLHLDLTKRVIDASFLGGKLDPIRESVLDMLDIAPILDSVERLQGAQEAEERDRFSRFSAHSSPLRPAMGRPKERALAAEDSDDDDESPTPRSMATPTGHGEKSYAESLRELCSTFDRDLRFICEGLRGVARASGTDTAGQWDLLAEMLEAGIRAGDRDHISIS
jgi:gamma-tubulin complex component 5